MLKIGIETSAYFGMYDSQEGLKKMKAHGYDCADYRNLADLDRGVYYEEASFEGYLSKEREYAQEAGIELFQLHAPWPPQDRQKATFDAKVKELCRVVYGASLLGCKHVVVHTAMPFGWDREPDADYALKFNVDFFEAILPTAERYGICLCIENLPMTALKYSRMPHLIELVDRLDHKNVGICLDTGHCAVFSDDPGDMALLAGERLKAIHVHDNNGDCDLHQIPYFGVINWKHFGECLGKLNFQGAFSLETMIPKDYPRNLREEMQICLAKLAKNMADQISIGR